MHKREFITNQARAWHWDGQMRGVYLCDVPYISIMYEERDRLRLEAKEIYERKQTNLLPVQDGDRWRYIQRVQKRMAMRGV